MIFEEYVYSLPYLFQKLEIGDNLLSVFFKVPNPGDCSFDTTDWAKRCGWSQRQDDDADWMQANYRQNPNTGADADHQGTQTGKKEIL